MKAPKLHYLGVLCLFLFFSATSFLQAQATAILSSTAGSGQQLTICAGDTFELFLIGGSASSTFEFYSQQATGTGVLLQSRSSTRNFIPQNPTSGTTFYALQYEDSTSTTPTTTNSLTLTVEPVPSSPQLTSSIAGSYYCSDQPITFLASGGTHYAFYLNDILFQTSSTLAAFLPSQLNGHTVVTAEVFNASGCSTQVSLTIEELVLTPGNIRGDQVLFASQLPQELTSMEEAQLNGVDVSATSSVSYQWESSLDGSEWHEVLNATGESYQPQNLVETVFFRRSVRVMIQGLSCVAYSNQILVQILSDEDEQCAAVLSVTIPFVQDVVLCNPAIQGAIRIDITGGNAPHQIRWETKDANDNWSALPHLDNLIYAQFLSAGTYRAQVSSVVSSTLISCTLYDITPEITVAEQNLSIISSSVSYDTSDCYASLNSGVLSFELENTIIAHHNNQITVDTPLFYLDENLIPANASSLSSDSLSNLYQLTGLSPGFHTLRVESSTVSFCSEELIFEIEEIVPLQFSGQQLYEVDPCSGTAQIEVQLDDIQGGIPFEANGDAFYDLSWTYVPEESATTFQLGMQNFIGYTIPNAQPGQYFLSIRDVNNCVLENVAELEFHVNNDQAAPFEVSGVLMDHAGEQVSVLNDGCLDAGENPGTIGLLIEKGIAPYTIRWQYKPLNSSIAFVPLSEYDNSTHLPDLIEGIYKLEVRSLSAGCSTVVSPSPYYYTEEFRIEQTPPVILQSPPIVDRNLCDGKAGNIILELFNNEHEELFFRLGDQVLDISEIVDGRYYHLLVEEPITEEEVLEIVNTNGCVLERVSIDIAIGEVDFYLQALSSLANNHVRVGEEVVFFNTSSSPYTRSEWSFGDGSNRIERDRVSETISPTLHRYLTEGSFSVQLKVFNATGCYSEVTQQIYVGKGYSIHTPNAFTPNDDFINDRFRPLITGFVQASLSVYDFRGNLLYTENIQEVDEQNPVGISFQGWDGKIETTGLKTFLYTLSGYLNDQTKIQDTGTFILIK